MIAFVTIAACVMPDDGCEIVGEPLELPAGVREASGLALSRSHDGVLWTHNDSDGGARIFAIDTRGALIADVPLEGAQNRDWEDIAVARCPAGGPRGDCIYIGDIGDNRATREEGVGVWVLAEPDPAQPGTPDVAFLRIQYPDGPRDAEALVVTDDGTLIVVSKGREHPVSVYRATNLSWPASGTTAIALVQVQQLTAASVDLPNQVTGASLGPDGVTVALRTYSTLQFHRLGPDGLEPPASEPIPLDSLAEPQGEGVALGRRGRVFLASEAGPQGIAPRMTVLRCRVP